MSFYVHAQSISLKQYIVAEMLLQLGSSCLNALITNLRGNSFTHI